MFRNFSGRTADDVWVSALQALSTAKDAEVLRQPSRAGPTREILHATLCIEEPQQRWVVSRDPPINPAFAIAEVVWILSGRNDAAFLNYFNRQLPDFAGTTPTYHGAYGHRLRRHFGPDQLLRAYESLSALPESRQVVLQIWDPAIDLPREDGSAVCADIPCNVLSLLKVRSGKLEWTQVLRSNDIYRGLPYNFVQFTTLQEVIAGWLNIEVGSYNQISDSLHIYEDDLDNVAIAAHDLDARNCDSLALSIDEYDVAIQTVSACADSIIASTTSVDDIAKLASRSELPQGYQNLLRLLCAEGVRRRKQPEMAVQIMAACTNPCLRVMFSRWCARLRPASER